VISEEEKEKIKHIRKWEEDCLEEIRSRWGENLEWKDITRNELLKEMPNEVIWTANKLLDAITDLFWLFEKLFGFFPIP